MEANYRQQSPEGFQESRYSCIRQYGESGTAPHWHDCIEIIFMEKESMQFFFDGRWQTLNEGEMIFIPPGRIHCTDCRNQKAEKIVIGFETDLLSDANRGRNAYRYEMPFYRNDIGEHCIFSAWDSYSVSTVALIRELEQSAQEEKAGSELYASGLLLMLFARIYARWEEELLITTQESAQPMVWKILQTIHAHDYSPLSPYDVARQLNISYSYMSHIFQEAMHMSFHEYMTWLKLRDAEKQLLSTDQSISEIAYQVGYNDFSYFIRQFRKHYSVSPGKYREQMKTGVKKTPDGS